MITDTDITKLKKTFATKEDLVSVRDELKVEISGVRDELKAEISGVRDELKAEISGVRDELKVEITGVRDELKAEISGVRDELKMEITGVRDELKEDIADIHVELGELHDKFDNLAGRFDSFEVKLDKIVGGLEDERLENAAGAIHLARHDRQIGALAIATSVTLSD